MDPVTPTIVLEAYKVGGIVGALLVVIGLLIFFGWKDARAREVRMSVALDSCQQKGEANTEKVATALANNTNVMSTLCDVMRDRPCLKDPTPSRPHSHIPNFSNPQG